jgi:glutamyl-tRNA reductase
MADYNTGLVVAGVNYRKAALDIRNKFALTTENIRHIYKDDEHNKPDDFFILSTCNRTEIYSITSRPEKVINLFSRYCQVGTQEAANYTFLKRGDEAIRHLFHVASGLDSQILGDYEIIGQLKNAFAMAKANNCTSGLMEKLVNAALQASRQVRNRTSISDGTTSISYAVIQLLKRETGEQVALNICLMGLGKIGTLTLKNLRHYLPQHNITVINRNELRARNAASEFNVDFAKLEQQQEVLGATPVLIVATGADHPIITKQEILDSGVKLIFDLSVPSNVNADVKEIAGLKMYDIDSLSQIVNKTVHNRQNEIPLAEQIIEENFQEFKEWERRRDLYKTKA